MTNLQQLKQWISESKSAVFFGGAGHILPNICRNGSFGIGFYTGLGARIKAPFNVLR